MTKIIDSLAAIVLAARDRLVVLDNPVAREVVETIDAWVIGRIVTEQLSAIERDMRRGAAEATGRRAALGDDLLGVAGWTADSLATARRDGDAAVAIYNACEAITRSARFATNGDHARLVAAAAMDAVEYTTHARAAGAAVR